MSAKHQILLSTFYDGGNDSFTSLLLHMNGADASTTFTDSSRNAHTVTAVGNAQIDTAQSKFDGASGLLDGTGDYLTVPNHASLKFGTGDFTIDGWFRFADIDGEFLFSDRDGSGTTDSLGCFMVAGEVWVYDETAEIAITTTASITTATWYHIEMGRSGTTFKIFVDGVEKSSATCTSNFNNTSTLRIGGDAAGGNPINGHIDEFRISKGIARHTAAFTPPKQAYF